MLKLGVVVQLPLHLTLVRILDDDTVAISIDSESATTDALQEIGIWNTKKALNKLRTVAMLFKDVEDVMLLREM